MRVRKNNDQDFANIPTKQMSMRFKKLRDLLQKLPNEGKDLSTNKNTVLELMVQFSSLDLESMWEHYLEPLTRISEACIADAIPILEEAFIWGLLDNQVNAVQPCFFLNLFILQRHQRDTLSNKQIQSLLDEDILTLEMARDLKMEDRKKLASELFFTNLMAKNITYEDTKMIFPTITEAGMNDFILSKKVHEQARKLVFAVMHYIREKQGEKYILLEKIGNHMIAKNYNDNRTLALHFKNYFYLALQRDFPGFTNKTTSGTTIRTLLNTDEYQDLRHIIFGDGADRVQYRKIRSFVCGENNTRLFGFCQRKNTYHFFKQNSSISVDMGAGVIKSEGEIETYINSILHKS